jgi:hypothetical protein
MASTPSYITQNRCGIFYFQYRVPNHFQSNGTSRRLFRASLHTRVRRDAIKAARQWVVWMDKLADKFFNDPTSFGKAMELLMAYKRETAKNRWESVETFLMGLDEREEHLLQKSLDYSDEKVQQEQSLNEKIQSIRKCIEMMHEGQVYSAIK